MRYTAKKKEINCEEIFSLGIMFDNGDYLPLEGSEVEEFSLKFYDKLVLRDVIYNGVFCPFVHNGHIKLKLKSRVQCYESPKLWDLKEFKRDRISYIKNRLTNKNGMEGIMINSDEKWESLMCFGNMSAKCDGEFLTINFYPKPVAESFESDEHYIDLSEVGISEIYKIELMTENCEGINFFKDEILDLQFALEKTLVLEWSGYRRRISSGAIQVFLDEKRNHNSQNSFFDFYKEGKKGTKALKHRFLADEHFSENDICYLNIYHEGAKTLAGRIEELVVKDIRSDEELEAIEDFELTHGQEWAPYFLSGCSEEQEDGSFLITFGKRALKYEKCQNILQECSIFNRKN